MIVKTLILMAVAFNVGFLSATHWQKAHYQEAIIKQHEKEVAHLKYVLLLEKKKNEAVKQDTQDRLDKLNALNKRHDDLLLYVKQLQTANNRLVPYDANRSLTSSSCDCRRFAEMEKLLNKASELIRERDEIAINYNSLYQQCKVINGDNSISTGEVKQE